MCFTHRQIISIDITLINYISYKRFVWTYKEIYIYYIRNIKICNQLIHRQMYINRKCDMIFKTVDNEIHSSQYQNN